MSTPFFPQLKLLRHLKRLDVWRAGGRPGPILLEVDTTGFCNADCSWCFYRGLRTGDILDTEAMMSALVGLSRMGLRALNWTGGGEPTLHPDLSELVQTASQYGIKQGLFTNAVSWKHRVAVPSTLSWIRVSLTDHYYDALDPQLVEFYASHTKTGICMNVTPQNRHLVYGLATAARWLGVAYFQVRPALHRSWRDQPAVKMPTEIRELETDAFRIFLSEYKWQACMKPKPYSTCRGGLFCPVIDYRGDVRWCNYFLHEPGRAFGNITEEPIQEIWRRMPRSVPVSDECQNCCKNQEISSFLEFLSTPLEDVDFI